MLKKIRIRSKLRDYQVDFVNDFAAELRKDCASGAFLVVDSLLAKIYHKEISSCFPVERLILIEAKEENKTVDFCQALIRKLIKRNIRKNSILVAVGGGVVQDICSFTASILYRGIDWKFFPTTLLAQADSCIGSKTSINFDNFKNLVGNFYPPSRVLIDINFLETLKEDDIKSGIGEMLHYYLIAGSTWAVELSRDYEKVLRNREDLLKYIFSSLQIKKKVIQMDEFDKGVRNLFNYGHTFGHAIESMTGYRINHGQAVTLGMDIANYLSLLLGYLSNAAFKDMHIKLCKNMPKFTLRKKEIPCFIKALTRDKKNIAGDLVCILTSGEGKMFKKQLAMDEKLKSMLTNYFYQEAR